MAMAGKRQREGAGGGEGGFGKRGSAAPPPQQQGAPLVGVNGRGQELPGADLGSGTRWCLGNAVHRDGADRKRVQDKLSSQDSDNDVARIIKDNTRLLRRCEAMLGQALSGSEHGDVRFEFEDGRSPLSGHRAVLCAASEEYEGMFRSGMVEEQKGIVLVPPGVSESGYRGLLEWVYLGRAGNECARADGRELWVLGEMYGVEGMLEWLLEKGIDGGNVLGAYEFGLVPQGVERGGIAERCLAVMEEGGGSVEEAVLRGVGREAVKGLALAIARRQGEEEGRSLGWRSVLSVARRKRGEEKRRLGWRSIREGYRLLEGWMRANGGRDVSGFREAVGELDLMGMPLKALRDVVGGCEYLDGVSASGLLERKQASGDNAYEAEYCQGRIYDLGFDSGPRGIALHGEGSEQRMAVADSENGFVMIFNVESGERMATLGSMGNCPGQFIHPWGVAFSSTGELYVGDFALDRISVFDRQGRYVRVIGKRGHGQGELDYPLGLCFTADGHLVVADKKNHRVQILREDGTFVRAFGSRGSWEGQFRLPCGVSSGPDGSIAVVDTGNNRVQVFDEAGGFLRSIGSKGKEPGQFSHHCGVAIGGGGEIIVVDACRKDVQVFGREGELLQIIGAEGDSDVAFDEPFCVATDGEGRLFVTDDRNGNVKLLR